MLVDFVFPVISAELDFWVSVRQTDPDSGKRNGVGKAMEFCCFSPKGPFFSVSDPGNFDFSMEKLGNRFLKFWGDT